MGQCRKWNTKCFYQHNFPVFFIPFFKDPSTDDMIVFHSSSRVSKQIQMRDHFFTPQNFFFSSHFLKKLKICKSHWSCVTCCVFGVNSPYVIHFRDRKERFCLCVTEAEEKVESFE